MLLIRILLCLLVLAAPVSLVRGEDLALQTLTFTDQHCALTIPKTWTLKPSNFLVEAHRAGGGSFLVMVKPISSSFRIDDPAFATALKNKLINHGHEIVSEDSTPFQGHTAYNYTMRKTINGFPITTHGICFVADGALYQIVTSLKNSDPTKDPELLAATNSFHLLDAPVAPTAATTPAPTP